MITLFLQYCLIWLFTRFQST